ncbi:hypothetical protein DsansV1_C04g0050481 [Dioscorea sansibarensis]
MVPGRRGLLTSAHKPSVGFALVSDPLLLRENFLPTIVDLPFRSITLSLSLSCRAPPSSYRTFIFRVEGGWGQDVKVTNYIIKCKLVLSSNFVSHMIIILLINIKLIIFACPFSS